MNSCFRMLPFSAGQARDIIAVLSMHCCLARRHHRCHMHTRTHTHTHIHTRARQFSHPRCVRVLFVSGGPRLGNGPLQMAINLCQDGDLLEQLKNGSLSWGEIFRALIDVADAMVYLSSTGFVHRDLAARNVRIRGSTIT